MSSSVCIVHPTVLLSIHDHFKRITATSATSKAQRVVGVCLGTRHGPSTVRITNSFAVPFEEHEQDSKVWFLDHNFLEQMCALFKKVNSRESIVGWYHSGSQLRPADLAIDSVIADYCAPFPPVLLVAPPSENARGYVAESVSEDNRSIRKFNHLPITWEAEEAEEIGVEHLLRNVRDLSVGDLETRLGESRDALAELERHLLAIEQYLRETNCKNQQIFCRLQQVFNSLSAASLQCFSNESCVVQHTTSLARSVVAMHRLISNRLALEK